jgi:hypothetical protein
MRNGGKKERYHIVRASDLKVVETVELTTKDEKYIGLVRIMKTLMIALPVTAAILIISSIAYHHISVKNLKESYNRELCEMARIADSCSTSLEETKRFTNLKIICADVMFGQDCGKPAHDKVWEFVKECDPWFPDIVMTQAVIESGCGTSNVYKRCNNLFGMKKPSSRTLRCDKNRRNRQEPYAEYENWKMSVIDRILWERWVFRNWTKPPTIDEYMDVIDKSYSETPDYAKNIHRHAAKYRNEKK